jgi:hypothetical protein
LGPEKTATIKLTYLTELTLDGGSLRFLLPTTIAPRYVPPQDLITKYKNNQRGPEKKIQ